MVLEKLGKKQGFELKLVELKHCSLEFQQLNLVNYEVSIRYKNYPAPVGLEPAILEQAVSVSCQNVSLYNHSDTPPPWTSMSCGHRSQVDQILVNHRVTVVHS